MFIKSTNFLSGSLQQELQKFRKEQGFSKAYSEMDKEFRSERVAVQHKDPESLMKNGFVDILDEGENVAENNTSEKSSHKLGSKASSHHPEIGHQDQSVYERLMEGNVAVHLDPSQGLSGKGDKGFVDSTIHSSMNAVMNVLGDDNFSQKMKNDSSNWAQNQYERVERVEDELQSRQNSRYERDYEETYGERENSSSQRRIDERLAERKKQFSGREQVSNDYGGRDVTQKRFAQRSDFDRRTEELQVWKGRERKLETQKLEAQKIEAQKIEAQKIEDRHSNMKSIYSGEQRESSSLDNNPGLGGSLSSKGTTNNQDAQTEVLSSKERNIDQNISDQHSISSKGPHGNGDTGPNGVSGKESNILENALANGISKSGLVDDALNLDSFSGNDALSSMSSLLSSSYASETQTGFTGGFDDVLMSVSAENLEVPTEQMSLSDITDIISTQGSILQDDTLISTVIEMQEDLLALSDVLYPSEDSSIINTDISLLLHAPNIQSAKSSLLQQIKNLGKPLGNVMKGLQSIQQNPNISMMDDFILDIKWEQGNSNILKNSRPGMSSQAMFSNNIQNQVQNESQNVFEQGVKAAALAESGLRGFESDMAKSFSMIEEQLSTKIPAALGTSLDGGQTGESQQDISTLLQNIDSKQIKELQKGATKEMFSKMVRVIERLMEQYKPPFDPNVLKQLEIRVQDPAGVIILDISQDKSQILVKAIVPDSIHQEFSQNKGDIESSLSEHGLELGAWEMTKQSESEGSRKEGDNHLGDRNSSQDGEQDDSGNNELELNEDHLVSKNI